MQYFEEILNHTVFNVIKETLDYINIKYRIHLIKKHFTELTEV